MEVLKTINEVWAANLRRYQGKMKQTEVAAAAGVELRNYQRHLTGTIPKERETIGAIAKALGVEETRLFLDPDLHPEPEMPDDSLREILVRLASLKEPEVNQVLAFIKALSSGSRGEHGAPPGHFSSDQSKNVNDRR